MANRIKEKYLARKKYFDYPMLFLVIFLILFGMVMIFSTSSYKSTITYGNPYHWLIRQAAAVAIGAVFMIAFCKIDYRVFKHLFFAEDAMDSALRCWLSCWRLARQKRDPSAGFLLEDFSSSRQSLPKSFWSCIWRTRYQEMPVK